MNVGREESERFQAGALVVHGIGEQAYGETLVSVCDAFADTAQSFLGGQHRVDYESALIAAGPATECDARAVFRVARKSRPETNATETPRKILFCEAFWADAFSPPAFEQVARWSVRVAPMVMSQHFQRRLYRAFLRIVEARGAARLWALRALVPEALYFTLGLVLTVPLILAVMLLLVLSKIPLDIARRTAGAVVVLLGRTLGDSLVLLGSPARRAAILHRMGRALDEVLSKCDTVTVIAHSQGCAVAHAVLRERTPQELKRIRLITVGSGLQKLTDLEYGHDGYRGSAFFVTHLLSVLGLAAVVVMVVEARWIGLVQVMSVVLLGFAATVIDFFIARYRHKAYKALAPDKWPLQGRLSYVGLVALGGAFFAFLIGVPLESLLAHHSATSFFGLDVGWLTVWPNTALAALVATGIATATVFIGDHEDLRSQLLKDKRLEWEAGRFDERYALSVSNWIDLYTEWDPVPNGPLLGSEGEKQRNEAFWSHEVHNSASILWDHTLYWQNEVQVMLRIAGAILSDVGITLPSAGDDEIRQLRAGPVAALAWLRWVFLALGLTLAVLTPFGEHARRWLTVHRDTVIGVPWVGETIGEHVFESRRNFNAAPDGALQLKPKPDVLTASWVEPVFGLLMTLVLYGPCVLGWSGWMRRRILHFIAAPQKFKSTSIVGAWRFAAPVAVAVALVAAGMSLDHAHIGRSADSFVAWLAAQDELDLGR